MNKSPNCTATSRTLPVTGRRITASIRKKHQVSAVENRHRQEIDNGEVYTDIAHEEDEAEHAGFKAFAGSLNDSNGSAQGFGADFHLNELHEGHYDQLGQIQGEPDAFTQGCRKSELDGLSGGGHAYLAHVLPAYLSGPQVSGSRSGLFGCLLYRRSP